MRFIRHEKKHRRPQPRNCAFCALRVAPTTVAHGRQQTVNAEVAVTVPAALGDDGMQLPIPPWLVTNK
jgi:hypothetical protein